MVAGAGGEAGVGTSGMTCFRQGEYGELVL